MSASPGGKSDRGAPRTGVVAAFAALYLIWGSTYLAIKIAVETLPPFLMGGVRFVAAGALLYAFCRLRGAPRPSGGHWGAAAIIGGCLLLGGNGGLVWAVQTLPSGVASLLVAMTSVWMVAIDWLRPGGVRPPARVLAGLALGFLGLAIFAGPGSGGEGRMDPAAVAAVLCSTFCWAAGSIYSRHAPLPSSSLLATSMEMLVGGGLLILAAVGLGEWGAFRFETVSPRSGMAFTYLLVVGSLIGFTAYIWLLKVSTPARVSTYAYVNPVVAVFLGWALAGETLTLRMIAGAAVILVAVAAITTAPPPARTASASGEPAAAGAAAGTAPPAPPALEPIPAAAGAGEEAREAGSRGGPG